MRILILFVEPMLYTMDLIREVYEQTSFEFFYIFCSSKLTGKDVIELPINSKVCSGSLTNHADQIIMKLKAWKPDFVISNGYVGKEQTSIILYCKYHHIPYAIESDTPLHVPENHIVAICKKLWLRFLLDNKYCYGFPGGTPQKENLIYYGIPEERNFIMPMSVSADRLRKAWRNTSDKDSIRNNLKLSGGITFLFVGRLEVEKNVGLLIEAFKRIENKKIELLIVGDGSKREELEFEAQLCNNIRFVGYQTYPDLIKYYRIADFLVLPSHFEPWGLVVNEAFSLSIPVIVSSAVGCQTDLVRDGINGFVFENDNVEELAHSLYKGIMCNISEMRENAYNTVLQWNLESYLNAFRSALECIMK